MVEMIDPQGNPDGQCAVAIDNIGAGTGEWVLLVSEQFRPPRIKKRNVTGRSVRDWHLSMRWVSGGQVIFPQIRRNIMNQQDIEQVVKAVPLKMQSSDTPSAAVHEMGVFASPG